MKKLLLCFTLLVSSVTGDSAPDEAELWSAPIKGDSRPAWWFDVWNKNGIIFIGEIVGISQIQEDDPIVQISGKDENVEYRLAKVCIKITKILYVDPGENELGSNMFNNQCIVKVINLHRYRSGLKKWIPAVNNIERVDNIYCIKPAGIVSSEYYVDWVLDKAHQNIVEKIIESRK